MGVHAFQTNFTGGVLSPHMFARTDFQKYANGAEILTNMVARVTGGAARRAGSLFVAQAKNLGAFQSTAFQNDAFQVPATRTVRLIPFVFNITQAYVLEVGPKYFRFYRNRQQIMGLDGSAASMVTNGDFASGLTGWTSEVGGDGAITDGGGFAKVDAGVSGIGFARLSQQLTGLNPGDRYAIAFRVDNASLDFWVGSNSTTADIISSTTLTPGEYRVIFTAVGTTATVTFFNARANTIGFVDDVAATNAVPVELATPYDAQYIRDLRYTQSADTLYIAHQVYAPRKLIRLSDQLWTLQIIPFQPVPSEEVPLTPPASLTPGAVSGAGVTFTASSSVFLAGDVNKLIKSRGGVASITAFVSGTQVTADIIQPFLNTNPIGAGTWTLEGSPYSDVTLSALQPVDAIITLTATTAAWRSTDVGAYVKGNDGIAQITLVTSDTVASARIMLPFTGPGLVLTKGAWTLENDSWSDARGWPGVVSFFEQRLWFASTTGRPQTIWGSRSGDYEDFTAGASNNDSVVFTIASNQVDIIRWMKAAKFMLAGTIGAEFKMTGGTDTAISPTNILVQSDTAYGAEYSPDAVRAGHAVIFVQRGGHQIRELAFNYETDSYQAPDLAILAEHLFRSGVVEIARMASPDSYLFAVLENGKMAVAAYERAESVVAWSSFETQGNYKSVCVIPNKCGAGDEVWTAVQRDLVGGSGAYIEVFDGQLNTDCAVSYDNTSILADTLVGLNHLNGMVVDVKYRQSNAFQSGAFQLGGFQVNEQGSYFTTTISGNSVTVPVFSNFIEIGLHYESIVTTLRFELSGPSGTAQFRKKRSNVIYARFYCSRGPGIKIEDEDVPADDVNKIRDFRKFNLGWDREGQVTIRQVQPFPMIVLGVSYAWSIDDGDS